MGKKKKQLTQAEIWDDSALLQSWNEALEEYKLYHSIHARGERVEDVLRSAEMTDAAANGTDPGTSGPVRKTIDPNTEDLEDGELEENGDDQNTDMDMNIKQHATDEPLLQHAAPVEEADQNMGTTTMPIPVLAGVQDEALKNLMMSWYYAGYYTGLYEGQQKAARTQTSEGTS